MEAVHQGLPIANKISLASIKSLRPGQIDGPRALEATCVDPQGECFFGPDITGLVFFSASKANGIQMGAPLDSLRMRTTQKARESTSPLPQSGISEPFDTWWQIVCGSITRLNHLEERASTVP